MELDPSLERMRALLSSYYGVQDDTDTSQVDDAKDIDCATFDSAAHVKNLLKTKTLPELVTVSDSLVNETKSLDVSMQTLVYENYSKFIAATDTIRQMKESVTNMDERMGKLLTGMDEMTLTSSVINGALAENRGKVEKLVAVRRLLKKLEFLFELPVRLNRSIELEAYSQAVKYYNMASGVLAKYDTVPSLHAIRVEADSIMDKLREAIRSSLREGSGLTDARVVECISLLVNLSEPRTALRDLFIRTQQRRLSEILSTFQRELSSQPEAGKADGTADTTDKETEAAIRLLPRNDASAFVKWLNEGFLDQYMAMADTFVNLFEKSCGDDLMGVEERKVAHAQLVTVSRELFNAYFAFIKRRLSFPQREPLEPTVPRFGSLVSCLGQVLSDARIAGQCVREVRVPDMAAEAIEKIIRFQVETVFSELRDSVRVCIVKEQCEVVTGGGSFEISVPMLAKQFHLLIDTALEACEPLVYAGMQLQPEMARQFAGLVQGLLLQSIEWMAGAMETAGKSTPPTQPAAPVDPAGGVGGSVPSGGSSVGKGVLLLACAARTFEEKNLREALDGFVRALPSRDQLSALGVDIEELQDLASALDEEALAATVISSGETLLRHYVMLQGDRLGALVKKSLSSSDWMVRKEPREPRAVVDIVIQELLTLRKEAVAALGERPRKFTADTRRGAAGARSRYDTSGGSLSLTGSRGGAGGGLQLDIERLFNQKQKIVDSVSFSSTSIVEGVAKVVFKTLVECIRLNTFGKNGFQQMQVDAAVFVGSLPYIVDNTRSGEELLSEAVASAGDRSVEATPMERSIIQSIVDGRVAKLEAQLA